MGANEAEPSFRLVAGLASVAMHQSTIRLQVELVPGTCWGSDLSTLMSERSWQALRMRAAEDAVYVCRCCGSDGGEHPLATNERWAYDDELHVQRLVEMLTLCWKCRAVFRYQESAEHRWERACEAWLREVNGWDHATADHYVEQMCNICCSREHFEWALDLRALQSYDVTPEMLGVRDYVLFPHERRELAFPHLRA